ncbi:MAG: xanthine dehydrogenase family protein molybdopterin-binding subunit, partial [Alphaproteobacteria bacterium]
MGRFGVGQPVRRLEDRRFLTGAGRYIDDLVLPRQAHAVFVRSPRAHADIRRIDLAAAGRAPGVLAVFTGRDLEADGIGPLPCIVSIRGRDGTEQHTPPRPALATDRVRYVGEPVAAVVAESLAEARDAAELVTVEYRDRPAVVDLPAAVEPGAPRIWDRAPGNVALDWAIGDSRATERAFARATHVVRLELASNRLAVNPIETRGAIGDYDPGRDRYTLHIPSQGSHRVRTKLAHDVFRVPESNLRVITPDVGGGFGVKIFLYGEQVAVLWAAKKLGRPVRWISERAESFLADAHARDQVNSAELMLDAQGRFLGLRVSTLANMGAYLSMYGPLIPTVAGARTSTGVYVIPAVWYEIKCVFTNTVPVDAYRGAGKPESTFVLERLIDAAARELGLGRDEIRRRNLIPAAALPYETPLCLRIDSGAFEANLDHALRRADWAGFEARRATARESGRLHGIGLAAYVENTVEHSDEVAHVRCEPDGLVSLLVGTQSNGQGHETAFAQLVADKLGLEPSRVRIVQGDTDVVGYGQGSSGSRSLQVLGPAIVGASDKLLAKARRIAAHMLEAAEPDLMFRDGAFAIAGTDRAIAFREVAAAAYTPGRLGRFRGAP